MPAPDPIWLYHFTHMNNLENIVRDGLFCDAQAHREGCLVTEVGNRGIKARRHSQAVGAGPGGTVNDYVPFYFAPRSPMLYAIHKGNVANYQGGQNDIVYLCTTLARVTELGLRWVATDRNAALDHACHTSDPADLDELIDWDLMRARQWNNSPEDPDRRERRQAELLVHGHVPWEAILEVVACDKDRAKSVARIRDAGPTGHRLRENVRPGWYF